MNCSTDTIHHHVNVWVLYVCVVFWSFLYFFFLFVAESTKVNCEICLSLSLSLFLSLVLHCCGRIGPTTQFCVITSRIWIDTWQSPSALKRVCRQNNNEKTNVINKWKWMESVMYQLQQPILSRPTDLQKSRDTLSCTRRVQRVYTTKLLCECESTKY